MRKLPSLQSMRCMSLGGWMVTIVVIVVFATAAIKITPSMLDFNSIKGLINSVISDNKVGLKSTEEIRSDIGRRFNINNISVIKARDINIEKENGELVITLDYEVRENFFYNVDLAMVYKHEFRKSVR